MKAMKVCAGALSTFVIVLTCVFGIASQAEAAAGDLLATVTVPVASSSAVGIGIAYDGSNILYTNGFEPTIYKTDLAGNNSGNTPIVGAPNCCNAIAYDASTGRLWGGTWDQCDIYEIDLATGVATLKHDDLTPCPIGFIDGLAWDPVNDTLWWSDDVNCSITEINKATGATIQVVNFFSLIGQASCVDGSWVDGGSSGLAVGLDHTLFMGSNGAGVIYSANANTAPPTFLGSFATVGGRDEDMECGPLFTKPDGNVVETLLSKDAYDDTFAVIEMEEGKCVSPVRNNPPDCSGAAASLAMLWPPNHKAVNVSVVGVTDPDGDPVVVAITGVSQDEPLNGLGDGNSCPDASLKADGTVDLRAERSGTKKTPGNGRVYHLSFVASDDKGDECSGEVTVCVPHDMRPDHVCVDEGPLYDSTTCF